MWCLFPFRWSRVRTPKQWSIYAGICIGGLGTHWSPGIGPLGKHTISQHCESQLHDSSFNRNISAAFLDDVETPSLSGENECEVGARKFWLWCWLRKRFTIGCHPTQCLWSYLVPHWSQQSVWIHTQDQQQWQWQHALLVMAKHHFNWNCHHDPTLAATAQVLCLKTTPIALRELHSYIF